MIEGRTVTLTALIGLFSAGACVCAFGLLRTMAGWPVSVADLLLFVLVGCAVTGLGWRRLMDAEYQRERLWMAGEELRQARLVAPVAETDDKETDDDTESDNYGSTRQAWALALDRFFRAGDSAGGFSIRRLDGVVGSVTWGVLAHFYGSGVGNNILRDAGGATGHTWGHGWSLDRALMALHAGRLPYPDGPVPVVQPYVHTLRDTRRQRKTVDGRATT